MPGIYKYYATRVHNMVIVRKTLVGLRQITSTLTKPGTEFSLKQVTYSGGIVVGGMPYRTWAVHGGPAISANGYKRVERTFIMGLQPFLVGGEKHVKAAASS